MLGDLRQRSAAVRRGLQRPPALNAHDRHQQVNNAHEHTAEHAGANGGHGNGLRLLHTQITDDLHHHDAEGKAGQRVHGVVAL